MKVKIEVGVMADDLRDQLKEQGLFIENDQYYQNALDAVSRLFVFGFRPESAASKARNKIVKEALSKAKQIGA